MYAGASQFLVVALLASGSSIWLTALTVIALDIRHVLYGPALYNLIPTQIKFKEDSRLGLGFNGRSFCQWYDPTFTAQTTMVRVLDVGLKSI